MNPTTANVADLTDDQLADMRTRVEHLLRAGFLYEEERPRYVLTRARLAAETDRRAAVGRPCAGCLADAGEPCDPFCLSHES